MNYCIINSEHVVQPFLPAETWSVI